MDTQNGGNATVDALKALIESAGLTDEQKRLLGINVKKPRGKYKFRPKGPMLHANKGDWVEVRFASGATLNLFVYKVTTRSLKLHVRETDYTATRRRIRQGQLPQAFKPGNTFSKKDAT